MKHSKPKKIKQRIFNSWITSLISISMVLIMIGMLGLVIINATKLSEYVREQIGFTLVLHENIKEVEIDRLQKTLNASDFVKSTRYINKDNAAKELSEDLGEDFTGFLGYNPLFASVEVKLFAKYTHPDSLLLLEKEFLDFPQIKEVYYQKNLVSVINNNVSRISFILIIISGLLTFIFVALINNTIRISVYSQRFTINTMQMVGASDSFIRKPFIQQSIFMGIYGAIIANILLFIGIYSYKKELTGVISTSDIFTLGAVFMLVLIFGLIISSLSTYLAVNKLLKLKFDELFY
ncbi:MAG: permease-like cell division protein FtsX [Draconibacterium sp.]|nr:permease-like cell division protein FtsX [Draconibacterium sp.]